MKSDKARTMEEKIFIIAELTGRSEKELSEGLAAGDPILSEWTDLLDGSHHIAAHACDACSQVHMALHFGDYTPPAFAGLLCRKCGSPCSEIQMEEARRLKSL